MGTKVFCKNCGKLNDKSSAFCMQCGKPLPRGGTMRKQAPDTSRCPRCGLPAGPDKRFCNNCGEELPDPSAAPADAPTGGPPVVDPGKLRVCDRCGIVNYAFRTCFSCGADLSETSSPTRELPAAGPDGRSASGRRRLCSLCLGFHPVEDVLEFDGKHYCPECIGKVQL